MTHIVFIVESTLEVPISASASSNAEDVEASAIFDKNIQQLMQMGFSEVSAKLSRDNEEPKSSIILIKLSNTVDIILF